MARPIDKTYLVNTLKSFDEQVLRRKYSSIASESGGESGTTDYTELQNKPAINNVELVGNKTLAELGIQPQGDYTTLEDVERVIDELNLGSYMTKEEVLAALTDKADITDIPSLEGYVTEEQLEAKGYLTEHQDLSNYATKDEIPNLDNYATESYVTEQISNIPSVDLTDYAKKNEIPDVSEYITEEQLLAKDYADKAYVTEEIAKVSTGGEIDLSSYLSKVEATETYVAKESGKSLIADTEIERLASVDNYDDTDIREELANKADITSIPTVDVTKSYVDTELAKKADTDHTHTTVNGHTVESNVPVDAKFTDTVYDDSSLYSKVTQNTNDISALKTADNVLSSRIDTLTSLSEGSTTGDAELQDIRVKADGTIATSAGNAVREQVSEIKGDLSRLLNSGSKWKGKTLNFMGDSITEGYASTVKYTDIIASTLSATCNNYGIGGSTVANGQNPMYSRVLQMEEDADLCVVFGGTNDFANYDRIIGEQFIVNNGKRTLNLDTNTFYGGLNQLCTNLYSRFPYSSLVLCTPINRKSFAGQETDMQANGNGLYLDEYVEAIKKVATYFSIPCLDLYATANLHPYDVANIEKYYSASDQLHPNAEGHKHIANVMLSFFDTLADKRGRTVHTHSYTSEVTTAASCTTAGVRTFTCECGTSYTESIPATGHSYVDGVCSVCGEVDHNYTPETTLLSISATYTGGKVTEGTALTDLKGLTVTAHYSDGNTKTVTGYTLNGEIAVGENTITVNYNEYTTTFVVVGVAIVNTYSVSDMSGVLEAKAGFYYLDGEWVSSPSRGVEYQSWKIPCNAGDKFTQYSTSKYGMYKTYWDADGNFISYNLPANGSPTTFTVPDNADIVYMWAAIRQEDINDGSYRLVRETVE